MTEQVRKIVTIWLGICAALIFGMVLLGGAVRLTGSGLSMVDWKPLLGVIPPTNDAAWDNVFEQYKRFPEFNMINNQISLDQFKSIYLMEYAHRMMGRLIGIVFLIPFLVLSLSHKITATLQKRLFLLFLMGAMQGAVGWYMVKSGLVDDPKVSQYRLVLHLVIAVLIYAYMIRIIVGLRVSTNSQKPSRKINTFGFILLFVILLMICSGGFVAGTHAGFIYNTFPTMGGDWIPDQVLTLSPVWRNFFENQVTIQFIHRILAIVVLILVTIYAASIFRNEQSERNYLSIVLMAAVLLQVGLGIVTLILSVPVMLGVAHQAGALILLTVVIVAVLSRLGTELIY